MADDSCSTCGGQGKFYEHMAPARARSQPGWIKAQAGLGMLPCPDCRGTGRDPGKTVVGPKGRTSNYYLMMVVWMIVFWFAFVISGNNLGKSWGFVNAEGALAGWYSVLLLVVPIVLAIVFRHWITFLATAALIVFAIYMLVILLA